MSVHAIAVRRLIRATALVALAACEKDRAASKPIMPTSDPRTTAHVAYEEDNASGAAPSATAPQGGEEPTGAQKWSVGGHDAILNEAAAIADRLIGTRFYEPNLAKLRDGSSDTDWAGAPLRAYYGFEGSIPGLLIYQWHHDPGLQNLHFLRNHEHGDQSAAEACAASRQLIKNAVSEALRRYPFDKPYFFYFLGHASHIIADSFAPAHVSRQHWAGEICDVCTFGWSLSGACEHPSTFLPWSTVPGDDVNEKPAARRAAVDATAGLLVTAYRMLTGAGDLESYLTRRRDQYTGHFSCQISCGEDGTPPCRAGWHRCTSTLPTCCGTSSNGCCEVQCIARNATCQ
jgi:hypothetical protein